MELILGRAVAGQCFSNVVLPTGWTERALVDVTPAGATRRGFHKTSGAVVILGWWPGGWCWRTKPPGQRRKVEPANHLLNEQTVLRRENRLTACRRRAAANAGADTARHAADQTKRAKEHYISAIGLSCTQQHPRLRPVGGEDAGIPPHRKRAGHHQARLMSILSLVGARWIAHRNRQADWTPGPWRCRLRAGGGQPDV
jgi:hypothetical protein